MIIDCPYCKSRVEAHEEGKLQRYDPEEDPFPYAVILGSCPSCKNVLVGLSEEIDEHDGTSLWSNPTRVWPQPKRTIPWSVPEIVKVSLEEADRCYSAAAYSACAVMCGRALEGVCVHFKARKTTLAGGLKALKDQEIIDARLYTWGEQLRHIRNLGAHATTERVSQEDAKDLLHFLHAICDYVFVLTKRFESFMKRREKEEKDIS